MEFEDLPEEIRRNILSNRLTESRLINTIERDILIDEFVDNPMLPTEREIDEYYKQVLSYVVGSFDHHKNDRVVHIGIDYCWNRNTGCNGFEVIVYDDGIVRDMSSTDLSYSVSYIQDKSKIYDARILYYALKSRSIRLNLNINDTRIKHVVNNLISKIINMLLNFNETALFHYLLISLNVLGVPINKYYEVLRKGITDNFDSYQHEGKYKINIPDDMIEKMLYKYRRVISKLEYDV
jgi:hypothetical protein